MVFKKAKNARNSRGSSSPGRSADLLLDGEDFLTPFSIGLWTPAVDKCQTESHIVIRVELPGVRHSDISVSIRGDILRIQGVKREPVQSRKLLCYYCLERRYGRFDRTLHINWVVNSREARAVLDKGILTIELPKLKDRRGETINVRTVRK